MGTDKEWSHTKMADCAIRVVKTDTNTDNSGQKRIKKNDAVEKLSHSWRKCPQEQGPLRRPLPDRDTALETGHWPTLMSNNVLYVSMPIIGVLASAKHTYTVLSHYTAIFFFRIKLCQLISLAHFKPSTPFMSALKCWAISGDACFYPTLIPFMLLKILDFVSPFLWWDNVFI